MWVSLPVALAREIDRILRCVEVMPLIGNDAAQAREALRRAAPGVFPDPAIDEEGYVPCEVCQRPIPFSRQVQAVRVGRVAKYDSDRCRETAQKRRQRQKGTA